MNSFDRFATRLWEDARQGLGLGEPPLSLRAYTATNRSSIRRAHMKDLEEFTKELYIQNIEERDAWGDPAISYQEYTAKNKSFIEQEYYKFLGEDLEFMNELGT